MIIPQHARVALSCSWTYYIAVPPQYLVTKCVFKHFSQWWLWWIRPMSQAWNFIFERARSFSFCKGHFHWKFWSQWETFAGAPGHGLRVILMYTSHSFHLMNGMITLESEQVVSTAISKTLHYLPELIIHKTSTVSCNVIHRVGTFRVSSHWYYEKENNQVPKLKYRPQFAKAGELCSHPIRVISSLASIGQ